MKIKHSTDSSTPWVKIEKRWDGTTWISFEDGTYGGGFLMQNGELVLHQILKLSDVNRIFKR